MSVVELIDKLERAVNAARKAGADVESAISALRENFGLFSIWEECDVYFDTNGVIVAYRYSRD